MRAKHNRLFATWIYGCISWLSVLFFGGGLTACHTDTAYHVYRPVAEEGWNKQDTLVYELPDSLPTGCYQLEVSVRHTETYPFRDIWLEVAFLHRKPQLTASSVTASDSLSAALPEDSLTTEPDLTLAADSMIWLRDTIHIYLADKRGRWLKGGTTGTIYQLQHAVGSFCYNENDGRTFCITHLMRTNPLPGIYDIGIRLYQPSAKE